MMKNSDPVKRSDALDKQISKDLDLNENVANLVKYGQRNRKLINLLFVSVIVEVILVVAVGFVFTRQQFNQAQIYANQNSLAASCKAGNEFRQDNLALWQYILAIPPAVPLTPDQQKTAADFTKFINDTFAPRDCKAIK